MSTTLLVAALCNCAVAFQDPVLSRGESAAAVREAEHRMAARHQPGSAVAALGPRWTTDPAAALVGRRCLFRVRFERFEPGPPQPDGTPGPLVLQGTLNASLDQVFTLADIDPTLAAEVDQATTEVALLDRQLDDARDELHYLRQQHRPRQFIGRVTTVYRSSCGHHGHCRCGFGGHDGHCRRRFCGTGHGHRHRCRHHGHCPPCTCRRHNNIHHESYGWQTARRIRELEHQIDSDRQLRAGLKAQIAQARRDYRQAVEAARHTLIMTPPPNWTAPAKMPRHFTATVRVHRVLWDAAATVPTLVLEADLQQLH